MATMGLNASTPSCKPYQVIGYRVSGEKVKIQMDFTKLRYNCAEIYLSSDIFK